MPRSRSISASYRRVASTVGALEQCRACTALLVGHDLGERQLSGRILGGAPREEDELAGRSHDVPGSATMGGPGQEVIAVPFGKGAWHAGRH